MTGAVSVVVTVVAPPSNRMMGLLGEKVPAAELPRKEVRAICNEPLPTVKGVDRVKVMADESSFV